MAIVIYTLREEDRRRLAANPFDDDLWKEIREKYDISDEYILAKTDLITGEIELTMRNIPRAVPQADGAGV